MNGPIGLYRDVWIAAIASSTTSLVTRTAAICVHFQGRRVRRVYVTMQITFLTRKSALIYRRGLRQRVASLTLNCNGDFAIRAYSHASKHTNEHSHIVYTHTPINTDMILLLTQLVFRMTITYRNKIPELINEMKTKCQHVWTCCHLPSYSYTATDTDRERLALAAAGNEREPLGLDGHPSSLYMLLDVPKTQSNSSQ